MSFGKTTCVVTLAVAVAASVVPREEFETRERHRIQAHFDSVLAELRAANVSRLDATRLQRRARLIGVLAAYRERGAFPHNYDVPDREIPTFIDTVTGVRCAVGHLMDASGRGEVVERVARTNQHVLVAQLASDTAFTGWLDESGISLVEAARIQVPYTAAPTATSPVNVAPALFALGSGSLAVFNLAKSRGGKHRWLSLAGIGAGAMTFIAGTAAGELAGNATVSKLAIGVGAASTAAGVFTLFPNPTPTSQSRSKLSLSPSVAPREARLGLSGRIRF